MSEYLLFPSAVKEKQYRAKTGLWAKELKSPQTRKRCDWYDDSLVNLSFLLTYDRSQYF